MVQETHNIFFESEIFRPSRIKLFNEFKREKDRPTPETLAQNPDIAQLPLNYSVTYGASWFLPHTKMLSFDFHPIINRTYLWQNKNIHGTFVHDNKENYV